MKDFSREDQVLYLQDLQFFGIMTFRDSLKKNILNAKFYVKKSDCGQKFRLQSINSHWCFLMSADIDSIP